MIFIYIGHELIKILKNLLFLLFIQIFGVWSVFSVSPADWIEKCRNRIFGVGEFAFIAICFVSRFNNHIDHYVHLYSSF